MSRAKTVWTMRRRKPGLEAGHVHGRRRGAPARLLAGAALLAAGLGAGAPAGAETLTFSVMASGTYDKAAAGLAPAFEARTGAKTVIAAFPWAILRQNNITDVVTGTNQYQVMSGGFYLVDIYPHFVPLGDRIKQDKLADGMIPGLMDPGRSEYFNGQQIGFPYGTDVYGVMVNDDLLKRAGVEASFKTWSDFLAACPTIESKLPGVACFSHPTGSPEQISAIFLGAYAGTFINAAGRYELDTAKAAAAGKLLAELWKHLPKQGSAMSFDEANAAFRDGKAAMLVTWPSFANKFLDEDASPIKGHWHQVSFPGPGFPYLSQWQLFLVDSAPDKDLAWAWIKTFAGPENARQNYERFGIGSPWKALYEDPELKAAHAHDWPARLADLPRAQNPVLSGEALDFLNNTLQDIANGRVSPEDGVAAINAAWANFPVPPTLMETARSVGAVAAR
ncbi:ABC transporter substrate-binding protein [Labrys wisconsinensis]|uniref:Multiple sugar transport system substrate-binding protein n=1 Tax=Labrys wisconsinensis TaxID=425677 RepID=A0ABU0JLA3_9HYPH|nr:extracellular solute-binding protein [Labrys wisconsinensis]MDQ0474390.1 multiple sugar transport system substrate-binding protein [Labrys wisconsinensis]